MTTAIKTSLIDSGAPPTCKSLAPTSYRYSTISDAHRCLKYYEYKHVLGLPDGGDLSADMAMGSALHLGIEDLFAGGSGVDVFGLYMEARKAAGLEYGRLKYDDLYSLGQTLLLIFAAEHMKKFTVESLEAKLDAPLGRYTLSGTVDCVGLYKGRRCVIDWKTSSYPYDAYKIQHNEQMYGYAHLVEHNTGKLPEALVYGVAVKDLKNPRWQFKEMPLTTEKQKFMVDNLEAMCEHISQVTIAGAFVRNPTACMNYNRPCPFFNVCFKTRASGGKE